MLEIKLNFKDCNIQQIYYIINQLPINRDFIIKEDHIFCKYNNKQEGKELVYNIIKVLTKYSLAIPTSLIEIVEK